MATLQKYKWIAAIFGVILTAAPILLLMSWLEKQGEAEATLAARWSIGIADLAISEAASSLSHLAARKVFSCEPPQVEALRQTAFKSRLLKEVSVMDTRGQTLCTDTGASFTARDVIVTTATPRDDLMLEVVRLADTGERLLRVRRLGARGQPSLAALLRGDLMLPRLTSDGDQFRGFARITLADGTLIASSGDSSERTLRDEGVVSRTQSEQFGPIVAVAMRRNGVIANYNDLRRIGMVMSGLTAIAILGAALIVPWRQHKSLGSEIERALVAGEFVPYYQPIFDIATGRLLGAEVLVRWRKPNGELIAPGSFISLAESSGLIIDLTRSLMRQVCIDIGPTMENRPDIYISFNVAPRHLNDSVILNDVGAIFEGSRIRLSQVVLEITERHELENLSAARRAIAALQALGCRVALDDVGTGHSGFSYILKLGVDIIKIDKLFVEAIKTDPQAQAIVATFVDLARNLRMKIIAEGVEQSEQVVYLRQMGIVAAQGYCFAPPLPASVFVQLVETIVARTSNESEGEVPGAVKNYISAIDNIAA